MSGAASVPGMDPDMREACSGTQEESDGTMTLSAHRGADGPLVIAIDSSTTSTKAVVVDSDGSVVALARRPIQLHTPAMDCYEHNPARWWETTRDSIDEAVAGLSASDRERIRAISITHQRETFAPFDAQGRALRPGILWLDGRATEQIRRLGSEHIHRLSGKPAGVTPALYKIAWLHEHEPDNVERAAKLVDVSAAITWHLTGRWASSVASADSLGLFDIRRRTWSPELLDLAGVRSDQMADLVAPAQAVGDLREELAARWGLRRGVTVVAGLGDGQAAGIGSAAVTPDVGFLNLGTGVNAGVESPVYRFDPVFRTLVSGVPGEYLFEVLQSSGSYVAGWFREAFGDPARLGAPDPALDEAAAAVPPGCEGLITLPYWNAVQSPYWDPVARGAIVGWRGTHSKAHMYRSILESIGFEMRANLDSLEAGTGTRIETLRTMGGGSHSELWCQIMADTTGIPLTICAQSEISALGAAVLAVAYLDSPERPDVVATARRMAELGRTVEPDAARHEQYGEIAGIQRRLYPRLRDVFEDLHAFYSRHPSTRPRSPREDRGAQLGRATAGSRASSKEEERKSYA